MLDFGREVSGRLELQSDSDQAADVNLQYGNRRRGTKPAVSRNHPSACPTGHDSHGPKGAFRYALLRFERGTRSTSARFN